MLIQTDNEFDTYINDILNRSRNAPAIEAPVVAILETQAPNSRVYPGMDTFGPPPEDYPIPTMIGVYFYYMKFSPDGSLISFVYHGENDAFDENGVKISKINEWIVDAQDKGKGSIAQNPDGVPWKGPCYLAFAMDSDGWSYVEGKLNGIDVNKSLYFHEFDISKNGDTVRHRKNETFFNAKTVQASSKGATLPILVVENHNIKYGTERARIQDEGDDDFKFDIYFRVRFSPSIGSGVNEQKLTFTIDPTGKNTGP